MRGTPYSSSPALGVYVVIFSPPIYSAGFIYPPVAESIKKGAYTESIGISPELPALA